MPCKAGNRTKRFGLTMQQHPSDFDWFANNLQVMAPTNLVVLGIANGGFETLLATYMFCDGPEGQASYMVDIKEPPENKNYEILRMLGVAIRITDIFDVEEEVALRIRRPGKTLLICDGGNKEREFNTFARYLKPGDVICVHDVDRGKKNGWQWSEVAYKNIKDTVDTIGLKELGLYDEKGAYYMFKKR